ncbi:hypothetical protein BDV27DRAFT_160912 [Aspergillus caelatus]|uniref:Carrier domain-containing protein n=1 Tax=Aspergillus caelatus TaxID=61420 RepID=A0A5N6ZY72_9EURO|nr:uncharacterized protein BDV27DRAFT_160912 [Aspergillus caelatus]KAE8361240.1 hypothetical protein BDV27DRAFT_160912 [Aspergillus caelatus]
MGVFGPNLEPMAGSVEVYLSYVQYTNTLTFKTAFAIPVNLCVVRRLRKIFVRLCLFTIAKLQKGESVLIHVGAGGIGQTAIRLALHIGAVVHTTPGSDQKKQLPIDNFGIPKSHIFSTRDTEFGNSIREVTGGVGIDVVLDSLAQPLLVESLGVLAPFGRLVQLGKVDVVGSSRMDMALLQPSVSFTYVDLVQLFHCKPKVAADLSLEVQHLVETGIFLPPAPLHMYPISQIKYAFRHFQSRVAGKVVLSYGVADQVKVIPRNIECKSLSPEGTYVVAGGQGGLGREICSWMAQPGAKSIVILSPSGSTNASTQELIEELGRRGTDVRAISCNISSREQLNFVLAVYAFARWRTSQRKPTRSIDIGPIEGAGYLHEKPEALDNLRKSNLETIPLDHLLSTLAVAISDQIDDVSASQLALGSFTPKAPRESSAHLDDPFTKHLHILKKPLSAAACTGAVVTPETIIFEALTVDRPTQEVWARIQLAIYHVSQMTGVRLQEIDPLQSVIFHGGDSLIVVEFRNWLQQELRKSFLSGKNIG